MSTAILGAGPIGLASAFELASRAESVTVISKTTNVGEAAHVNAGWHSLEFCRSGFSGWNLRNSTELLQQ